MPVISASGSSGRSTGLMSAVLKTSSSVRASLLIQTDRWSPLLEYSAPSTSHFGWTSSRVSPVARS